MKEIIYLPTLFLAVHFVLSCSGAQFEEGIPPDNTGKLSPVAEALREEELPTLNDLGYATSSNATLVVKEIESYEGSATQAYYLAGFLGGNLPDQTIATSASTRILLDPDSLRIYVSFPNNNFTILGWNGIQRPSTIVLQTLGLDTYVTPLRIDYNINDQQLSFKGTSSNYTPCAYDGWGRTAEIIFDGVYSESIKGYEGNFTWSEGEGEAGHCKITCTGTMDLILD